jgi:hypothetical protein
MSNKDEWGTKGVWYSPSNATSLSQMELKHMLQHGKTIKRHVKSK